MSPPTSRARVRSLRPRGPRVSRLINISSLAAAGPASPRAPRSEDDPPAPINAYGRSKLAGERAVASVDGLRWTTLRPGVVYGPRDRALLPLFQIAARGRDAARRPRGRRLHLHPRRAISCGRSWRRSITRRPATRSSPDIAIRSRRARSSRTCVRPSGARAAIVRVPDGADARGRARRRRGRDDPRQAAVINSRRYAELASEGFVCRVDRLRDRLGIVAAIGLREGLADACLVSTGGMAVAARFEPCAQRAQR